MQQKNVVKVLKAKETKAVAMSKRAVDQRTGNFYKRADATAFKLKQFVGVESKVKAMRN